VEKSDAFDGMTGYLYRRGCERVDGKFCTDRAKNSSSNPPLPLDPRGAILHEHRNCACREDDDSVDNHADRYLDRAENETLNDDTS
jgi:hypothetical protein